MEDGDYNLGDWIMLKKTAANFFHLIGIQNAASFVRYELFCSSNGRRPLSVSTQ